MAKGGKSIPVRLDVWDRDLLESIAQATGSSEVGVLRWALRFYAVNGPWSASDRNRVLRKHAKRLYDVGPNLQEVE